MYHWTAFPEPPEEVQLELGLDQTHPDQGSAESWLSDAWAELAAASVHSVSLFDGDRLVYGPMSLSE